MSGFKRVLGSATKKQEQQLLSLVKDPNEGFGDREDRAIAATLATEILHNGISYQGKTGEEQDILDQVVSMAFHDMGLGEEIGVTAVCREPITLALVDELIANATNADVSMVHLFKYGWRFQHDEPPEHAYFILLPEEVSRLKSEVETLLADHKSRWRSAEMPQIARERIVSVLDEVIRHDGSGLYARRT
jgi:hypothetical protein